LGPTGLGDGFGRWDQNKEKTERLLIVLGTKTRLFYMPGGGGYVRTRGIAVNAARGFWQTLSPVRSVFLVLHACGVGLQFLTVSGISGLLGAGPSSFIASNSSLHSWGTVGFFCFDFPQAVIWQKGKVGARAAETSPHRSAGRDRFHDGGPIEAL